ncbi:hypothetical protein NESM_000618600 [Novymonas esmeraldas]|uniref:Uncharacterized protein n=1 Tax=Novymonas esmeraldas TaxID=1808958 RepID=A0AAW0EST4_9TRYP
MQESSAAPSAGSAAAAAAPAAVAACSSSQVLYKRQTLKLGMDGSSLPRLVIVTDTHIYVCLLSGGITRTIAAARLERVTLCPREDAGDDLLGHSRSPIRHEAHPATSPLQWAALVTLGIAQEAALALQFHHTRDGSDFVRALRTASHTPASVVFNTPDAAAPTDAAGRPLSSSPARRADPAIPRVLERDVDEDGRHTSAQGCRAAPDVDVVPVPTPPCRPRSPTAPPVTQLALSPVASRDGDGSSDTRGSSGSSAHAAELDRAEEAECEAEALTARSHSTAPTAGGPPAASTASRSTTEDEVADGRTPSPLRTAAPLRAAPPPPPPPAPAEAVAAMEANTRGAASDGDRRCSPAPHRQISAHVEDDAPPAVLDAIARHARTTAQPRVEECAPSDGVQALQDELAVQSATVARLRRSLQAHESLVLELAELKADVRGLRAALAARDAQCAALQSHRDHAEARLEAGEREHQQALAEQAERLRRDHHAELRAVQVAFEDYDTRMTTLAEQLRRDHREEAAQWQHERRTLLFCVDELQQRQRQQERHRHGEEWTAEERRARAADVAAQAQHEAHWRLLQPSHAGDAARQRVESVLDGGSERGQLEQHQPPRRVAGAVHSPPYTAGASSPRSPAAASPQPHHHHRPSWPRCRTPQFSAHRLFDSASDADGDAVHDAHGGAALQTPTPHPLRNATGSGGDRSARLGVYAVRKGEYTPSRHSFV